MVSAQIDRLQKDSHNLEQFITELQQAGNVDRASKISKKKEYLDTRIAEIMAD